MKRDRCSIFVNQSGATMIELLYVIVIIGILASISIVSYSMYKEKAEYAKAEATLRNARTAFEVGDQDAPDGLNVPITFSGVIGGPVVAPLATILPGAQLSIDVRLGAAYNSCTPAVDPATVHQFLIAQPCRAGEYIAWAKLCNGTELTLHNVPQPDVC